MARKSKAEQLSGKAEVDAFMERLEHPMKAEIEAVRALILTVNPRIEQSVKWNALSFSTTEHFCTFKLRPTDRIQLVFHTGAKARESNTPIAVTDPHGWLKWAAPDRCMATFADMQEIEARRDWLLAIVREWISQM